MISVIMATYNGEKYLKAQLDSILNQSTLVDEIVIVDDHSSDKTLEILKEYKKKYSIIKIYPNEINKGHFYSFIKGMIIAKGDFIFFSDQDDIWEEKKIEVMLNIYNDYSRKNICIQSNSIYIDSIGKVLSKRKIKNKNFLENNINILKYPGAGYEMMIDCELKKKIVNLSLEELKYFDYHDVLIGYMALIHGSYIRSNIYLNQHRIHNNNVTANSKSKYFSQSLEERIKYITNVEKNRIKGVKEILEKSSVKNKEHKISDIEKYYSFLEKRKLFLEKNGIKDFFYLLRSINYYRRKETFFVDCCYAFKINKLAKIIVNRKKRRIYW